MSSCVPKPVQPELPDTEWARLIPGEFPKSWAPFINSAHLPKRRTPSGVDELVSPEEANSSANVRALLLPRPLLARRGWNWLRSIAADFLLVGFSWLLLRSVTLSFGTLRRLQTATTLGAGSVLGMAILHGALITLLGYSERLYEPTLDLTRRARSLGKSVLLATVILGVACGLQAGWSTSHLICWAGLLDFCALLVWRWREASVGVNRAQGCRRRVLIVGAGRVGRQLGSYIENHPELGRELNGFLDDGQPLGHRIIGRSGDLPRLARTGFVDEVILAAPKDKNLTLQILHQAESLRLDVQIVPELFDCKLTESGIEQIAELPLIAVHAEHLPEAGLAFKRILDIAFSSLALLVFSPLFAVIAALIKIDSPGPVLYAAPRAGRKGSLFRCFKFRTMVCGADALKASLRKKGNQRSGPFFKIADDPRVTRLGRVLRRYSLDELPQLWNVLKGEMSLVGPRPHPLDDVAGYEIEHFGRLDVAPGITGLWQVSARRDPSFRKGMELDREYIRRWSLSMDLNILLKTVLAVARGSGQ